MNIYLLCTCGSMDLIFKILINLFIVWGCAGSLFLHMGFLYAAVRGLLFFVMCGLLIAVASLVEEYRL